MKSRTNFLKLIKKLTNKINKGKNMVVGWIDKKPIKKHLQYIISWKESLKQQTKQKQKRMFKLYGK